MDVRDDPSAIATAMRGCTAVIHLAAAKADERWSEDVNVRGTANVWHAAETAGVKRAVYVSTQSARLKKPGTYGRTKRKGEDAVRASSVPSVILRPSLVYGGDASGVFGTLLTLARLPLIPVFGPGIAVFRPVHVDDLAAAIVASLDAECTGATLDVGGPDALTFDALILEVLRRSGVRRPLVHIPRFIGYALAALPGSPITRSNVIGGIERIDMDVRPMRDALGVDPRPFRTDTSFERALLGYVFRAVVPRWMPSDDVVARMTAAMRVHGIAAKQLPPSWLLGPIDAASRLLWPNGSLQRSLRVAVAIAESQPTGADALLPKRMSIIAVVLRATGLCLRAMSWQALGLILTVLFFSYVRRHGA